LKEGLNWKWAGYRLCWKAAEIRSSIPANPVGFMRDRCPVAGSAGHAGPVEGDEHAAGNPHFMTDPVNGKIAAKEICDSFCQVDSPSADYYRANLARFIEKADAKLVEWQKRLAPFHGKRIVTYHNSWVYFAERFGLKIDLFLEPKPGIPPTPANLAHVKAVMKEEHIGVIIVEPYLDRKTAETVAQDTGATVVDVAQFPGGVKGTEGGYIELIDYLVNSIAKAFEQQEP